jgi:protein-S-isoprenylcysteine O-methyltransferase Ste14
MTTPRPASVVWIARLLVVAQLLLLAALVLVTHGPRWPTPPLFVLVAALVGLSGAVVMLVAGTALGRGLTATPLPNSNARLRTGGLYRYVRHPIYSGLLLLCSGYVAVSGSSGKLVVLAALVLLLNGKARWEERHLALRFPEYPAYAARTPRFVPVRLGR